MYAAAYMGGGADSLLRHASAHCLSGILASAMIPAEHLTCTPQDATSEESSNRGLQHLRGQGVGLQSQS